MTIRELNALTDSGEIIVINYAGHKEKLNRFEESFQMIAYGDYLISGISTIENGIEAEIKLIPAKI